MPDHISHRRAALYLFAAMMLTGANLPLGKYLIQHVPVYLFTFYRFAICSIALGLVVRSEAGPHLRQMRLRQIRDVIFMALFGMVGFTIFMLAGLRRTSAIDAGVITATIPAIVVLLGVIFLRERPTLRQLASVALAVLGIGVVQAASARGGTSSFIGNFLIAGAVFGEASFVIFSKRLAPPFRPIRLALAANLAGLVLSVPLAAGDLARFDFAALSWPVWILGTWYVLAAGVFCLLLWYRGLPHVETYMAGIAMSAIPITAFAISFLFLGETIGIYQIIGAVLVVMAITLGATAKRRLEHSAR